MTRFVPAVMMVWLATIPSVRAQTKLEEQVVQNLPRAFCDAFDKQDGHKLAQIMSDDVDFVTAGAMWPAHP